MHRIGWIGAGMFLGASTAVALLHVAHGAEPPSAQDATRALGIFGEAFATVSADYVTPPDNKTLVEGALTGMLGHLDPHSSYFDPATYTEMLTRTEGSYDGVGLVVGMEDGVVRIVEPMPGTPGGRSGIKAGDRLLAIDGKIVMGLSLDAITDRMRGKRGTRVTLTVLQKDAPKPRDFTLQRTAVEVGAVTHRREGRVGYIRIPAFNDHTAKGVSDAVTTFQREIGPQLRGYIIDLRDDGGGTLNAAIQTADDFLDGGEIVTVRGRDPHEVERYDAGPGDIAEGKPIIVLVNRGTASASEILAGALHDHKRARVVGMTSFGKGSVQSIVPLDGGNEGALHLTTARYYTPSGRSIQATGIVPDVVVSQTADGTDTSETVDMREVDLPDHLPADGGPPPKAPKVIRPTHAYKDFQLAYALDLLRGSMTVSAIKPAAASN